MPDPYQRYWDSLRVEENVARKARKARLVEQLAQEVEVLGLAEVLASIILGEYPK